MLLQLSELRRWQSQAASKSQEVGAIQADINAQQAANAALNKQQVALQAEVSMLGLFDYFRGLRPACTVTLVECTD